MPHLNPEERRGSAFTWAFILNISFTVIEFIGGMLTQSTAIISDAIHDLGDSLALGMAWYLEKQAGKGRSSSFTFGYRRFSVLGALINSTILVMGAILIVVRAVWWFFDPQIPDAKGMLWLAILGVAVNAFAYFKLHSSSNLNQRTASLHLLEDVFGWVAVLIGALVIDRTGWYVIDPILSIAIGIWIFFNAQKNLRKSLQIFLQGNPLSIEESKLEAQFTSVNGVNSVHDVHLWTLDGEYHVISLHMILEKDASREVIMGAKEKVRKICLDHGISHVTIEAELEGESTAPQIPAQNG
ncbi:MAG: cation diffusion facilitator family transporter [Bacteroidota bacterium]|nr:cation diffusion facilitator family transporter [Bacteroidota bacterium]MDX5427740.1 cation diffusion facilitator family transporter [Bacteroidota bacterium]MDX5448294.1 cation diffusion facilitator family transporter [Bacteroidota bacterium]MDX5505629.1 cation diffusion facilitator family transporter [Bacteroidota bacterium]